MQTNPSVKARLSGVTTSRSNSDAEPWCLGLVSLLVMALLNASCATTPVPVDPAPTCVVPANEFNSWFETGAVSLNGVVNPADSVNFPDSPNCSFYKWSEQMFLWLNSPAPPSYGGGDRIFASAAFYDVSPPGQYYNSNGYWAYSRTLIPHPPNSTTLENMSLRPAKPGPHGLPVIRDERGRMLEIQRPQLGPTGKQLVLDVKGEAVEVERITAGGEGRPVFFDRSGREIPEPKPLIQDRLKQVKDLNRELVVQKFMVEQKPVFMNLNGNVVVVEQGQADGAVLMAQNGSLVYYQLMVNDVYAYFATGVADGAWGASFGSKFPTTQVALNQIKHFAISHGRPSPEPFPDPNALTVEIKTAWVEADGLVNLDRYITMDARIPLYNKVSSKLWVRTNNYKVAKMALVGMHVVGSTDGQGAADHSEMLWATFEHEDNTPNAKYRYTNAAGQPTTVNPDFSKAFLFCQRNPPLPSLNIPHMKMSDDPSGSPDDIIGINGFSISPSNTIRGNAWGAAFGVSPNPIDATDADSNSALIAINNSVRGMLDPADVRNHYMLTGMTWTINGGGFTDNFGKPGNFTTATGTGVGTSQLANTTMETYQQALDPVTHQPTYSKQLFNCFSCHQTNTTDVSHIFRDPLTGYGLKPLF
jgi:hypothetical protein